LLNNINITGDKDDKSNVIIKEFFKNRINDGEEEDSDHTGEPSQEHDHSHDINGPHEHNDSHHKNMKCIKVEICRLKNMLRCLDPAIEEL
jgi:hypothetical protein